MHLPTLHIQDLDFRMLFCPVCGMHFAFSSAVGGEGPPSCPVKRGHPPSGEDTVHLKPVQGVGMTSGAQNPG